MSKMNLLMVVAGVNLLMLCMTGCSVGSVAHPSGQAVFLLVDEGCVINMDASVSEDQAKELFAWCEEQRRTH